MEDGSVFWQVNVSTLGMWPPNWGQSEKHQTTEDNHIYNTSEDIPMSSVFWPQIYAESSAQTVPNCILDLHVCVRRYTHAGMLSTIYFIRVVLQTTVWVIYTRQIENQQVLCSLDTEATISPYHIQYASNLIKDTSSLVYCLTMFDVCHMFVL